MNFLLLGDGPDEQRWARALADRPRDALRVAYPGVPAVPGPEPARDLEDALAAAGVDAAVVGGPPEDRAEWLRRVAALGLPAICLHPPGPDAEAYYAVALSRAETGAVVVPDLPLRLHPGVLALKAAVDSGELGSFRALVLEREAPAGSDLVGEGFARDVDAIRAVLGEVEAVTATGDPPGGRPADALIVALRTAGGRRGEVRLAAAAEGAGPVPARLSAQGSAATLTLEYDPGLEGPARLIRRPVGAGGAEAVEAEFDAWDGRAALLDALAAEAGHPDLLDGTRAMELAEAAARSLRRGRTVELHYEEVSEAGSFKSAMTSIGCLLLLAALVALPVALAGPALGLPGTVYIAWAIPPLLVGFLLLQVLRPAAPRREARRPDG